MAFNSHALRLFFSAALSETCMRFILTWRKRGGVAAAYGSCGLSIHGHELKS